MKEWEVLMVPVKPDSTWEVVFQISILKLKYLVENEVSFLDYCFRRLYDEIHNYDEISNIKPVPSQFIMPLSSLYVIQFESFSRACFKFMVVFNSLDFGSLQNRFQNCSKKLYEHLLSSTSCLQAYIGAFVDQNVLRDKVCTMGIAFIANGSILPRRCRNSDKPLKSSVLFQSPPSLEVEFNLPHSGTIRGMLIPRGVTVITGGGFHGKSTLLRALSVGALNKIPGDGREFVVTDPSAVNIRAEDGRYVHGIDISNFFDHLPSIVNMNPRYFHTSCASGSTSQAVNLMESLEINSKVLLLDEDTCAANFMVRDSRMRAMVASEPIIPFIYRVNSLWLEHGVSSVVVIGGCGDWFDVQDTTLLLENYACHDATKKAASISRTFSHGRVQYNGRGLVHRLAWPWPNLCTPRYLVISQALQHAVKQMHSYYFGSSIPSLELNQSTKRQKSEHYETGSSDSNKSFNDFNGIGVTNGDACPSDLMISCEGTKISFGSEFGIDLSRVELHENNPAVLYGIAFAVFWILQDVILRQNITQQDRANASDSAMPLMASVQSSNSVAEGIAEAPASSQIRVREGSSVCSTDPNIIGDADDHSTGKEKDTMLSSTLSLVDLLDLLDSHIDEHGLFSILPSRDITHDENSPLSLYVVRPVRHYVAFALNRLRGVRFRYEHQDGNNS